MTVSVVEQPAVAQERVRTRDDLTAMTGSTCVMTRADAAAISQFRQVQYRRSPDLTLADESVLLWDGQDDRSIVLAVRARDRAILATMRAEPLLDMQGASRALDCPVPISDPVFPAMLLGRGATRADCQQLGLNSLMRFLFLRFARERGIRHVYGRVYGEAARTHLMRSIGYNFLPHPKGAAMSAGTAGVHSSLYVAVLDLETHGDYALRTLAGRAADLLARFPLMDQLESDSFAAGGARRAGYFRDLFNKASLLAAGVERSGIGASGTREALRTA
ncbi:MAG: hypothetical protein ACREJ4_06545 [Candidatus Methylomirabilaceae bacterium]